MRVGDRGLSTGERRQRSPALHGGIAACWRVRVACRMISRPSEPASEAELRRALVVLLAPMLMAKPMQAQYANCPWDVVKGLSKQQRDSISAAIHTPGAGPRIEVRVSGDPSKVKAQVVYLLSACGFPLKSARDFLITAEFDREIGLVAQFEISARTTVVPVDSGALVSFVADETQLSGRAIRPTRFVQPSTAKNKGRSGSVWRAMRMIADSLGRSTFP